MRSEPFRSKAHNVMRPRRVFVFSEFMVDTGSRHYFEMVWRVEKYWDDYGPAFRYYKHYANIPDVCREGIFNICAGCDGKWEGRMSSLDERLARLGKV